MLPRRWHFALTIINRAGKSLRLATIVEANYQDGKKLTQRPSSRNGRSEVFAGRQKADAVVLSEKADSAAPPTVSEPGE